MYPEKEVSKKMRFIGTDRSADTLRCPESVMTIADLYPKNIETKCWTITQMVRTASIIASCVSICTISSAEVQSTISKLKAAGETEQNGSASATPKMVVRSPYKKSPVVSDKKEETKPVSKIESVNNKIDFEKPVSPSKKSSTSTLDGNTQDFKNQNGKSKSKNDPHAENSTLVKVASESKNTTVKKNVTVPAGKNDSTPSKLDSLNKETINKKPDKNIEKKDKAQTTNSDTASKEKLEVADSKLERSNTEPVIQASVLDASKNSPNFYISPSGINKNLSVDNEPIKVLDKQERPKSLSPALQATSTPKSGILSNWLHKKENSRPYRNLSQSNFSSDYKNRKSGEVLPVFLDGAGYGGTDLPIGGEDSYRLATLPSTFRPTDLTHIPVEHCFSRSDIYLRREAAESLVRMFNDAARAGLSIKVFSGYRDYSHQSRLYTAAVARGGISQTGVARPGKSEHHLGTTADVTNSAKHLLSRSFQDTAEGQWLSRNASRYGWKMTVMAGEGRRSHSDEPWHLRYLGKNVDSYKKPGSYQIVQQSTPAPKKGMLSSIGNLFKR